MSRTPTTLFAFISLATWLTGCPADVPDTVEGTAEYTGYADDDGAAGAAGAAGGAEVGGDAAVALEDEPTEMLVNKEPGAWATTVPWSLEIQTGCQTNAGTNATVYAQKQQYSYLDRYKKAYWVNKTYTLDDPSYNDNEQCSYSRFNEFVLKSYTDSSAIIKRLRLWHNNGGSAPGWYVDYAILRWNDSYGSGGVFMCTFNRWIYKDEVAEGPCCEAYLPKTGPYKCVP